MSVLNKQEELEICVWLQGCDVIANYGDMVGQFMAGMLSRMATYFLRKTDHQSKLVEFSVCERTTGMHGALPEEW